MGCHSSVYSVSSVMSVLRELNASALHMPRKIEFTYEQIVDASNEYWIRRYEEDGLANSDILAGRVFVSRFAEASQLEAMIDLIFPFFDKESENWTRLKHRYNRMEKNFARTLYNAIIAVKNNIDFYTVGAKPPVDRITFYKLLGIRVLP